jgi:RNA recognition motif-containing protein
MNIYVSNLGFIVQDQDLKDLFTPFGEVLSAKVITDKFTGRSKGFGFVDMPDDAAAKKAIAQLNSGIIDGRAVKVVEARPKEERSSGNRNSNNERGFSINRF